ncbi:MAG TPA: hypothetical protein VFF28_02900 [Candidatus Nanoarchaeia archaeon]|nr:hypothetical protein [Candidatus Nanoarchaeia archaeon]
MKKLLLISLLLLIMPVAFAEDVDVNVYLLNLGKYEISTGSFTADFYLSMKCESDCGRFEFMNGRADKIDAITDEPNEKFYRIQAILSSPVDLAGFPFDKQKMQIIIEDKEKTIEDIKYIATKEKSGLDESIAFSGWQIDGWDIATKEHYYPPYDETYSQYVYTLNISRIPLNAFIKTFLPVFFMILIVMFTFIMDTDKIATRIAVTSSSLVAAVMFHISVANQIPPVGYLTVADKFMILTYFIILLSVVSNVMILEFMEQKKIELAEKIHRRTEYSVFIIIPLMYLLFFIF